MAGEGRRQSPEHMWTACEGASDGVFFVSEPLFSLRGSSPSALGHRIQARLPPDTPEVPRWNEGGHAVAEGLGRPRQRRFAHPHLTVPFKSSLLRADEIGRCGHQWLTFVIRRTAEPRPTLTDFWRVGELDNEARVLGRMVFELGAELCRGAGNSRASCPRPDRTSAASLSGAI